VRIYSSQNASFRLAIFFSIALSPIMPINPNLFAQPASHHDRFFVYVGTYGKGVQAFRFASDSGSLEPLGLVGTVTNPSWVGTDPTFEHLYAVSELEGNEEGSIASFTIDRKTGKLHPLNHVASGGEAPCYLSVDATDKMLIVANYSSGGVSAFPIEANGSLGKMSSLMTAHGSSVDKARQEGPHAHEAVITSDNQRVYVPDLGLDQIRIYKLEPASAKLVPNDPPAVKGEPGLGPRHMMFDKSSRYAYVINELKPVVSVYAHDTATGNLTFVQAVPTIPGDFSKENSGAEIRMDKSGRFVYTSNRGHDSIQVFAIDSLHGTLRKVQDITTGGEVPRGFNLDPTGRFLLVGNQQSNNLVIFKVDSESGKLSATGQKFEVPSPVDVLFVPAA
jgi:6-phosphogluconolactonase